jgi:hypothetical protein
VFENTRVRIAGRDSLIEWFTRSHALGYREHIVSANMLIEEDSAAVELEQDFTADEDVPHHYVAALKRARPSEQAALRRFTR